jgi:hypothetical protein
MAKTATKTKVVSKSAKGKGKAKAAPVAKKKPAVKKVKAVKDPLAWKEPNKGNALRHVRYSNVSISDVSNEKYPELVQITAAPSRYDELIGKRYLNLDFAVKAVNTAQAENLISTGGKKVKEELIEAGLVGIDAESI